MIYTLTLNPAIDYVVGVNDFEPGTINRTSYENIFAGGKGLNVSTVLGNLDIPNIALGFVAGQTGGMLNRMANDAGLATDFIECRSGNTRINVKLKSGDIETEINGQGSEISDDEMDALYKKITELNEGDCLIMSGSVPSCLKDDFYKTICEKVCGKGIDIVIDARGKLLLDTVEYHPLLIKPNNYELGEMFGVTIDNYEDAITYALRLRERGAKNVMVSMGSKGAILVDEYGESHICEAPVGEVVNSVGAGDTTVAAFIAKYYEQADAYGDATTISEVTVKRDYAEILKYAVAAGSATAFKSGLATRMDIEKIMHDM